MLTKQDLLDFESEVARRWEAGLIKAPIHLSGGNEEQLIEIFKGVRPHDYVFSTHRNHYHALLHNVPASALMDEICGESIGTCGGRARSMGFIDHARKFYSSAIVGGCVNIAVGVAVALKRSNQDELRIDEMATPPRHVWCFVGDGAVDGGHFWEALKYAIGHDLPVTFILEHNDRATCTSWIERNGVGDMIVCVDKHLRMYAYKPTYPHVGTGKYVQF
jgi:pyruvate dehydrogenase E1 component alpha subunit